MKTLNKKNGSLLAAVSSLLLVAFALYQQPVNSYLQKILLAAEQFNKDYPQQKVFFHFDKPSYTVGETMWMKGYVSDVSTNKPDQMSTNLYVEMVNSREAIIQTRLLLLSKGTAHGDFTLPDTLPEGNYMIRAYTSWMRNFDQQYIFTRSFYIRNPENENFITSSELKFNRRYNKKIKKSRKQLDLQFFPEGGVMVVGLENRIAFKAVNGLGSGVDISGSIMNKKGNKITDLKSIHQGTGSFLFVPEPKEKYTAIVKDQSGKEYTFKLPEPVETGYIMKVDNLNNEISVSVSANVSDPERTVILTGLSRNRIYYSHAQKMKDGRLNLRIPVHLFPGGITVFTLFDNRGNPQAERLVFLDNYQRMHISVEPEKKLYSPREKVNYKISVSDDQGNPVKGNFSVAITDAGQVKETDYQGGNIVNYMLLSSELRGKIEEPGYYFDTRNPDSKEALDLLMMTQGWRRFSWEKILNNEFPEINYPVEDHLMVGGQITREFFKIPLKEIPVKLSILSTYNDTYETKSDDKGYFIFKGLVYYDTISARLEAEKPSGRKNLVIELGINQSPGNDGSSYMAKSIGVTGKGEKWTYKEANKEEIEQVRQQIIDKENEERNDPSKIYGRADNVLYMKDIPPGYNNLLQVIQGRIPGVVVSGNSIIIRGINSIYMSSDPLILIDGVPSDMMAFRTISPEDVERIEVLKGPSASIYGSRGANGVIAVYTKRGQFMKKGVIDFKMLGYYSPREFYTPAYNRTQLAGTPDMRPTVYWNPEIITDENGQATFSFYTSDARNNFRIVVQGISDNGLVGAVESGYKVE